MEPIKMGLLAASNIAACSMVPTVEKMDGIQISAVGARSLKSAQDFVEKHLHNIPVQAYGSYQDLVSDPEIDLIYVSSPQSYHYEHTMLALNNGKHVLCEKALMLNAKQAQSAVYLAREKNLFLGEAIWTRYIPFHHEIINKLNSGIIGQPMSLIATNGFDMSSVERIVNPLLGGGALLDVGIYAITCASMLFGDDILEMSTTNVMTANGVDAHSTTIWKYVDGRIANIITAMDYDCGAGVTVFGTKGKMIIEGACLWSKVSVYDSNGNLLQVLEKPPMITGFEFELQDAIDAIRSGNIQPKNMPHDKMILIMQRMDDMRSAWNFSFPSEI